MSPEQAQNAKNVDHRTDLYSLAITLHHALSGQRPWQGCSTMGELILAICTKEVTPLGEVAPWIDPKLAAVVQKALRRNADERYASAEELGAALEPFAGNAPVRAEAVLPVSAERRRHVSHPPALAATAASATGDGQSSSKPPPTARGSAARRVGAVVVVGGAALVAVGIVLAKGLGAEPKQPLAPMSASAPASAVRLGSAPPAASAPAKATLRATVRVEPPAAEATVRGAPREVQDGQLALEGVSGEAFEVTLQHEGATRDFVVVITSDAKTVPTVLALPAAAPQPEPSKEAAGHDAGRRAPPYGAGAAGRGTGAPTAPERPTAEPSAAPATTLPALKTTW